MVKFLNDENIYIAQNKCVNSVPIVLTASLITVVCSNFVKIIRREIVRYLPDKKQNFHCLSNCRYCADRVQIMPEPAPNNVLRLLQVSSKSANFRCSYSRTRKTAKLPRRMNLIFGGSLASSRIIIYDAGGPYLSVDYVKLLRPM